MRSYNRTSGGKRFHQEIKCRLMIGWVEWNFSQIDLILQLLKYLSVLTRLPFRPHVDEHKCVSVIRISRNGVSHFHTLSTPFSLSPFQSSLLSVFTPGETMVSTVIATHQMGMGVWPCIHRDIVVQQIGSLETKIHPAAQEGLNSLCC